MKYREGIRTVAARHRGRPDGDRRRRRSDEHDSAGRRRQAGGPADDHRVAHDWCDYGEVIESFKKKYGLKVNELNPDAGSGDEIEAIKANKGNKGPQAPDVIDVGLSFGPSAKKEGLLQPHKVATWETIPAAQKDAEGYWYGDYYGVLSFEVNTDIVKNVPADWADLLKPRVQELGRPGRGPARVVPGDHGRARGRASAAAATWTRPPRRGSSSSPT